jgi:DNA (cytosine-5)-methyltransferase 1
LLDDFQRFVEYYKPGYLFIENVPGFRNKNESPIDRFKYFLNQNGYKYVDAILNAKDYSVPQNRRRYILIATRLNKNITLPDKHTTTFTVRDAIGDYRKFKPINAGFIDTSFFLHTASNLTKKNLKRIQQTPHDGGDRKSWENDKSIQLVCYKNHKGHYDVYGRMFWNKPSPTITTRFNSYSNGRYGHPEQDRAISLREGATLQTFPLDYVFHSKSRMTISKMIGNAVPPMFAKCIANSIINSIRSDDCT